VESPEGSQTRPLLIEPLPVSALFLWGRVARPQGLRGYVIVDVFSTQPEAYDRSVFWVAFNYEPEARPLRVEVCRPYRTPKDEKEPGRRRYLLRFAGYRSRSDAEALRQAGLYLPKAYLPPLPEGQFYYVEAEGAQVVDANGQRRGILAFIQPGAAYDFFVVRNEKGEEFWIPAPFVVRLERGTVPPTLVIEAPEGLWDPSLAAGKP